jgi:spore germination protein GerM
MGRVPHSITVALILVTALAAGCGLRPDERPQPIPRERLDDKLFEEGADTAGGSQTATVYVLSTQGGSTMLVRTPVPMPSGQNRQRAVLEALLAWTPTGSQGSNPRYTSRIPNGTVLREVRRDGDVLTVDLADFTIAGTGQAQALAQIVYTATETEGIKGVVFTIDGKPVAVPLGERSSTPGQPLDRDDFSNLDLVPPTTTTAPPEPPEPPVATTVPA